MSKDKKYRTKIEDLKNEESLTLEEMKQLKGGATYQELSDIIETSQREFTLKPRHLVGVRGAGSGY